MKHPIQPKACCLIHEPTRLEPSFRGGCENRIHPVERTSRRSHRLAGGGAFTSVLRTRLAADSKKVFEVVYTPGPSLDPTFILNTEMDGKSVEMLRQGGLLLVIPGNGSLYVSGHTNNYYDQKKKFVVRDGRLVEVKQPFYYVGIESGALRDISISADKSGHNTVAHIPKGGEVTVLLNEGEDYLLKTPFGLLGWVRIRQIGQEAEMLERIFFAGIDWQQTMPNCINR